MNKFENLDDKFQEKINLPPNLRKSELFHKKQINQGNTLENRGRGAERGEGGDKEGLG